MGILQRMLVKKEFYKLMMESPKRRFYGVESVDLPLFTEFVREFIGDTEEKINTCINAFFSDLNMNIKLDKYKSNRSSLAFLNVNNPEEEYLIENGDIRPVGAIFNREVIEYAKRRKTRVEKIFRYYETIVSSFSQMSVPLTTRVEFRYGFFEDCYFYLKDDKGLNGVKIYDVEKEIIPDKFDCYFFNLDDMEEIFKKTIVPDDYTRSLASLKEFVSSKEQKVRDDISIELKKQESKQSLIDQMEDNYIEILKIEKELTEVYGENQRVFITSEHLFENNNGVKRIKDKWLPYLPYINLANISFAGVDIRGVDFSYTNVKIDPQIVYKKDLSNCRFVSRSESEWIFSPDANFLGCILDGAYIDDAPVKYGINRKAVNLRIVNRNEYHN